MFLKNYKEDIERLGIPMPTLDVPTPIVVGNSANNNNNNNSKDKEDTNSTMSKESGEQLTPLKEMDKNMTLRSKKPPTERGSSMALNEKEGTAKDRLLSKAFGKKSGSGL